ncbi:hypothetical protein [Caulobacter sp. NIBR1757]|uniref:hypothetical protein n=1 Tax=Caulobacter sp. NIBR1757 TaxID=3016000 RepID=UPI0022F0296A|nr:hypothetical protein [Caulobacter sp. NIBR1757]WGM39030.1 hypothetical protein AMEJIAPC_01941 [Caulobacter sp. NIBR1757]
MSAPHHPLRPAAFERLREQLATAVALCDDAQILSLADGLHDALRRRRAARHGREDRSWSPAGLQSSAPDGPMA